MFVFCFWELSAIALVKYDESVPLRLAPIRVQSAQVSGVRGERYDYSPGFAPGIAAHAHEELQVCYSTNGGGQIRTGRQWRQAIPDRVYIFPANQEHTAARDATVETPATYHVLYISPGLLTVAGDERAKAAWSRTDNTDGRPNQLLERSVRNLLDGVWSEDQPCVVEEAVHRMLEVMGTDHQPIPKDGRLAAQVRDALLADTVRCASLAELAMATGETAHRVRAVFKQAFGVPPARYHLLQRLNTARRLLIAGKPPAAVAAATGFVDQAHLSNRMRRYFGHTPGMLVGS